MKNSFGTTSAQVNCNRSINKRCSVSNSEKGYDSMRRKNENRPILKQECVVNNQINEQKNSFSLENNNDVMNKSNFLTYDKKVKAFHNLNLGNNSVHLEDTKLVVQKESSKENNDKCKNHRIAKKSSNSVVVSPQPRVSQESFNKMSHYVNNTFRKASGRKNSYYSFSSQRRKDNFSKTMNNPRRKDGTKSERPFSVKSNSSNRDGG